MELAIDKPKLPKTWDYEKSVETMKNFLAKWTSLSANILQELYIAREKLNSQGARTDLGANAPKLTWERYCQDAIGRDKSTVNRWLAKAFPGEDHGNGHKRIAPCLKSPIAYFGGKSKQALYMLPLIPWHSVYVEVFGGGASLLFSKHPDLSEMEIYNDIDRAAVTFFRIWMEGGEDFADLRNRLDATLYARKEYEFCRDHCAYKDIDPNDDAPHVELARRWFVMIQQSFMSRPKSGWSRSTKSRCKPVLRWMRKIGDIHRVQNRLRDVVIECQNYKALIADYDAADVFFYLDPPYPGDARQGSTRAYAHEMFENTDHEALVEILLNVKAKVMLSGYDTPIYKPLEAKGWHRREIAATVQTYTAANGSQTSARTEVLWMNYEPPE